MRQDFASLFIWILEFSLVRLKGLRMRKLKIPPVWLRVREKR